MTIERDEVSPDRDPQLGRRLLAWIRPYRWGVLGAVALLLVEAGLALVGPALTQRVIDVAIPARDGDLLLRYALAFLGALTAGFAAEYGYTVLTAWVGQRVMSDVRRRVFGHLQRLSLPYFDRQPVGRLVTRVTSDVESLNELFSSGVVTVLGDVATLVAISAMMLAVDWRLALLVFTTLPLMVLVVALFRTRMREAFRTIRGAVARLNGFLQEHLSGVRVVQLFDREAAVRRDFAAANEAHLAAQLRSITLYALFFPIVEVLTATAVALLLWVGGVRTLDGAVTVGTLAAFIQLARRFFQPLQDLSEKFNLLQSAMASGERIFRLLDTPIEVPEPVAPRPLPTPARGEVRFEDVWFRYAPEAPWALRGVTFTVPAGATVALVGPTGAGKSTILSLLLRHYLPTRGRILLDGVDIAEVASHDVRSRIGFVPQDLFLFRGNLERNLRLDRMLPDEALAHALATAGADALVARLPGGLSHEVAERGRSLSVGERQLLSFARALAGDPPILLLDEATSAIDPESEGRIQDALSRSRDGRTAIVVAHRLGTITEADRILVFHHGELTEAGTHRELLGAGGRYDRLVRLQRGAQAA
ncbi:MAG: ABC transporter ATP-binding protein [Phycisphaerales bacterium]